MYSRSIIYKTTIYPSPQCLPFSYHNLFFRTRHSSAIQLVQTARVTVVSIALWCSISQHNKQQYPPTIAGSIFSLRYARICFWLLIDAPSDIKIWNGNSDYWFFEADYRILMTQKQAAVCSTTASSRQSPLPITLSPYSPFCYGNSVIPYLP